MGLSRKNLKRPVKFLLLLATGAYLALPYSIQIAQTKKPISKKGMLEALRANGLSTADLVERVRRRGVNFQLSDQDEAKFRAAGAEPELIEAIKANYRPEESSSTPPRSDQPGGEKPAASPGVEPGVPSGPPLSFQEIITLLQSGAGSDRVQQFVEVRGVSFMLNPQLAGQIKSAGGSAALVEAIDERATPGSAGPSAPRTETPASSSTDYDDLTDQAMAAIKADNAKYAINLLESAIVLDRSRPTAYTLLGFAELYGVHNIALAESPARAAIQHGGSALFRIFHDHDGGFKTYCQGSLFITKIGISFKADNGQHTFTASRSDLSEVKLNSGVGSQLGAFHVKMFTPEGQSRTYNFGPLTRSKEESNLIIGLIERNWQ
jgi:hypothetical protein